MQVKATACVCVCACMHVCICACVCCVWGLCVCMCECLCVCVCEYVHSLCVYCVSVCVYLSVCMGMSLNYSQQFNPSNVKLCKASSFGNYIYHKNERRKEQPNRNGSKDRGPETEETIPLTFEEESHVCGGAK